MGDNFCSRDVYEIAANIATELEIIADLCGVENVSSLVHKIISVLENLENTTKKLESAEKEVSDLKKTNVELLSRKDLYEKDKVKHEQEYEELEENWKDEKCELEHTIAKLKGENRHFHILQDQLNLEQLNDEKDESSVNQDLRSIIDSLSTRINEKDLSLQTALKENSLLQSTVQQLIHSTKLLEKQVSEMQDLLHNLTKEKSFLKHLVLSQEEKLKTMEENLSETTQEKLSLEENLMQRDEFAINRTDTELPLSKEAIEQLLLGQQTLVAKIAQLEQELFSAKTDAEGFKKKYLELCKRKYSCGPRVPLQESCAIRQLFNFLLGVVTPPSSTFRS